MYLARILGIASSDGLRGSKLLTSNATSSIPTTVDFDTIKTHIVVDW